jgi:hypothetical protein
LRATAPEHIYCHSTKEYYAKDRARVDYIDEDKVGSVSIMDFSKMVRYEIDVEEACYAVFDCSAIKPVLNRTVAPAEMTVIGALELFE